MDRGKDVILGNPLGNQDRVLIVVAVPRHKRDNHVFAQRQFTQIGGRTIGDHLTFGDGLPHLHQRTLVDAGVLVRALEFPHAVDVHARIAQFQILGRPDHDPLGVNLVDHPGAFGLDSRPRVDGNLAFDPSANQRGLRPQQRHSLTLHV